VKKHESLSCSGRDLISHSPPDLDKSYVPSKAGTGQERTVADHAKIALKQSLENRMVWLRTFRARYLEHVRARATVHPDVHRCEGRAKQVLDSPITD
jgi:hypothetical protein